MKLPFLATFTVARFTLQTRKLWLVGRCRDRPSRALPWTCPNVKNKNKMNSKIKNRNRQNKKERKIKKKMGVLMDTREGQAHQICSFMWTDNYWIMSHSKTHLEQMTKDLMEEAERWDLEPETCRSVVDKHLCLRDMEDFTISTRTGQHRIAFEKEFQASWRHLPSSRTDAKIAWKKESNMQTWLGGGM